MWPLPPCLVKTSFLSQPYGSPSPCWPQQPRRTRLLEICYNEEIDTCWTVPLIYTGLAFLLGIYCRWSCHNSTGYCDDIGK
ncbi:hypothetical protein GDO78_009078 [Eleutherodactylus coqui]|uniref:Uncharacterized protein n=1 Tax=Eleutherodactylus coqui TaxID=57060 RepID=A0A8J6K8E1_ELECQ|nr:hypothetical protein GDO78_009078 [Eleutherodactylus coqui]